MKRFPFISSGMNSCGAELERKILTDSCIFRRGYSGQSGLCIAWWELFYRRLIGRIRLWEATPTWEQ